MIVCGVLVDLDDTLYPQADYLDAAWLAVAERGCRLGVNRERLLAALRAESAAGSDRGGLIDRALAAVDAPPALPVAELIAAFHASCPPCLTPFPGVSQALATLRRKVPVALVSDGNVTGQQRKLAALGLTNAFDAVVLSDQWGRTYRKPHPRPFQEALRLIDVPALEAVMIGDRPDKDIAGAAGAHLRAIRVHTGEYTTRPDHPATWRHASTFADAVTALTPLLPQARD